MRVNEEGFQVELVTEWREADSFSRLLGSSFCGWPPETSGSKEGWEIYHCESRAGLDDRHPADPKRQFDHV